MGRMSDLVVDNPFTLDTACTVRLADETTVSRVLDHAKSAARAFRTTSIDERIALSEKACQAMESRAEEIAQDISKMMGKPVAHARGEVKGMAQRWRHMNAIAKASLADLERPPKEGFERRIVKEPLGVIFDLPAWNYPLLTAVNAVAPAILAGNSVIVKHSPRSPLCGEHFERAFKEAGAPAHLVQSLHADHPTSERIVGDARVDHVLFTGSVFGGHRIQKAASERFLHVGLELGGNDPAYVAEDCDVQKAAESLVDGAMFNAGQSCCAIERVYVHASKYEAFVAAAEAIVRAYVLGDPMADATTMGPIAQPNHPTELEGFVANATQKGARLVVGGKRTSIGGKGRFFEPTLLRDVTHAMELFQKESFGPILPVAKVGSDEEALLCMNDSKLGLTAAVYTQDRDRAARMARDLEAGTVFMNRCDALDPALPWSGVKDTGRGVTLSSLGFDYLTRPKAIHFKLSL